MLELNIPAENTDFRPKIIVIGVGGAGGNAVNNMIKSNLSGVDFIVANTDAQALAQSSCDTKIQLGTNLTEGLGAGANPEVGKNAAQESLNEILDAVKKANMVFITAGMGGGTGTGAAPVIAEAIRASGILTVAVVTKPFQFEGRRRLQAAEAGVEMLEKHVDTLICIPNQNLFLVADEKTTFTEAFDMADDVLYAGVRGISDLMVSPGMINMDFADVQTIMSEMGKAVMGTGEEEGSNRAVEAAEAAISNPLLEDTSMKGARSVLINVTGGDDLTLMEIDSAVSRITEEVDENANVIFGTSLDNTIDGRVRVSIVATGIDDKAQQEEKAPSLASATLSSQGVSSTPKKKDDFGSESLCKTSLEVSAGTPSPQPSVPQKEGRETSTPQLSPLAPLENDATISTQQLDIEDAVRSHSPVSPKPTLHSPLKQKESEKPVLEEENEQRISTRMTSPRDRLELLRRKADHSQLPPALRPRADIDSAQFENPDLDADTEEEKKHSTFFNLLNIRRALPKNDAVAQAQVLEEEEDVTPVALQLQDSKREFQASFQAERRQDSERRIPSFIRHQAN